ncbi:MAG TPA: hypothetical protein VMS77_05535 [Conexivisphaerales archaeon]|nr:hypothetical protein [Conexivisphaerales archaeon]
MIQEHDEFYWPKNLRSGVYTVLRIWEATEYKYGQPIKLMKAEVADAYSGHKTWNLIELEESFARGWAVPYTAGVPRKAREKLNTLAIQQFSTTIDPTEFLSFNVDGIKINTGITSWTRKSVGFVDDKGHVVRKQALLNQVKSYLTTHNIT